MPGVGTAGPYPTIETVMNLARAFVNDTFAGATNTPGEGRTFTDSAPFTIPFLNAAIEELSEKLENNNVTTMTVDGFIITIPPVPSVDPGIQANLAYTGFFNGATQAGTPTLPADLLMPLQMWERPTGSTQDFNPVDNVSVLPAVGQVEALRYFTWNQDQINFCGAVQSVDIRLRYKSKILPTVTPSTNFANTVIGSAGCLRPLAYAVAEYYATARLGGAPPQLTQRKDAAIQQMITRYVRMQQAQIFSRIPYGSEGNTLPGSNAESF